MHARHHTTTTHRPSFTLTATALAAALPALVVLVLAFPLQTLAFFAGVATVRVLRATR